MRPPALVLLVPFRAEDTRAARCVPEEQLLDPSAREQKADDPVSGGHHAQAAAVEVTLVGIGPPREGMMDEHDAPLETLEAVGSFDKHVPHVARQPFLHGVNLGSVRTNYADHPRLEAQLFPVVENGCPSEMRSVNPIHGVGSFATILPACRLVKTPNTMSMAIVA
jgi:hypothetical protein